MTEIGAVNPINIYQNLFIMPVTHAEFTEALAALAACGAPQDVARPNETILTSRLKWQDRTAAFLVESAQVFYPNDSLGLDTFKAGVIQVAEWLDSDGSLFVGIVNGQPVRFHSPYRIAEALRELGHFWVLAEHVKVARGQLSIHDR